MTSAIKIANRFVGPNTPPLLLPDIGTFFNQDIALAVEMIRTLQSAGAEVIKGELLHDPDICLNDDTVESYYCPSSGEWVHERYRDLIERKTLALEDYEKIFNECRQYDLPFVVSVYDFKGVNFAKRIGASALKVATSNIVHEPLIRHCARTGLPLILDTGKSSLTEISRAVHWARGSGSKDLIVEHSPPPPPSSLEEHNLAMINVFERSFSSVVGLSDHYSGPEMLFAAVALGAHVLEKGVCSDNNPLDQDVSHALPIGQFYEVNRTCQSIYSSIGTGQLAISQSHKKSRMGLVASEDLNVGAKISLETVSFAFPATGIPVENWSLIEGWKLRNSISYKQPIRWSDVEPMAT